MGHVLAAERGADLYNMVELALEDAGYSVAALVESNLTVELLESQSNPVVVLLNKQASQCILVDVLTQSHPISSLPTSHVSDVWSQSGQRLRSFAVDRYRGVALADDVFATRLSQSGARLSSSRSRTHQLEPVTRRLRRISTAFTHMWKAFTHVRVREAVAVGHLIVLALLGSISGLLLRSWWSLIVVPAVYLCGVAMTFLGDSTGPFGR